MLCPSCQTNVPEGSVFCPKCGERVEGGAENKKTVGATIRAADDGANTAASGPDRFRQQLGAPKAGDDDTEDMLWEGGYSPKAMFTNWVGAGIFSLVAVIGGLFIPLPMTWLIISAMIAAVWLYFLAVLVYRKLGINYRLTSQRFIHEQGVLARTTDRIEVIDIDDVSFRQTIIDRMVGVGTIKIESADRSHPELVLRGIDDVKKVYDLIDGARRKERVRRGIHIASAGTTGGL